MNRPKQIGTAGETGVKRYAEANGFPLAERRALAGQQDLGDILLCPGAIVEVKAGKKAQGAYDKQVADWLEETERERQNARADIAILVIARAGYAPARCENWRAIFPEPMRLFIPLIKSMSDRIVTLSVERVIPYPIEMSLAQALDVLRRAGWGEPLT